ncbi:Uncharacterised protein [Mycobacterium tuberculosis]|nr:Uncharacterised protein [Mycobacterium tuberculosis]
MAILLVHAAVSDGLRLLFLAFPSAFFRRRKQSRRIRRH